MKIVLGLGNPGARYARTRHNIGWVILDAIAKRLRADFEPGTGDYVVARGSWQGRKVVLIKPTTWMNNSGKAAKQALRHYGGGLEELLVLVDEIQFPIGKVKMTPAGSSGGHNGVESLLYYLGTENFPRLRLGVGNEFGQGGMVDYVLSEFRSNEQKRLEEMIEKGKDATLLWIAQGTAKAMNQVNALRRKKVSEDESRPSQEKNEQKSMTQPNDSEAENGNNISTDS
ncbi:MAG: aminoacyl-tRNA hydrolase [Chlorobi bacterium]|nr:aminoacyl-tRNA hydrolase [Chlorobiota bacterium]